MGVPCPSCGSRQTTRNTRGTTWLGTPRVILTCLECGAQWFPGQRTTIAGSGCGGCLIIVLIFIAGVWFFRRTPDAPVNPVPNVGAPAQPVPVIKQAELNPVNGYKEIANLFSYGADELALHAADTKDKVATLWMRIKGISSDEEFGQWLVGLMERAKKPAADKFEEADRLVAAGQLQFSLALANRTASTKTRGNLREVSGKLKRLFGPTTKVSDVTVKPPTASKSAASVPTAKDVPKTPTPVQERKPAPSSEEMTTKRFRAMLSNARNLIKAKVYPPARKYLRDIIDEAPGTPEADEAKTLLDSIPK
jgi:hypothetical protein